MLSSHHFCERQTFIAIDGRQIWSKVENWYCLNNNKSDCTGFHSATKWADVELW